MSLRALASETAIYGLSSILGRAAYFFLTPLYTSVFSEADYGVQTQVFAVIGMLLVLATLRLDVAYFRHVKDAPDERLLFATSWLTTATVGGALGLALLGLSPSLAAWFGFPRFPWVFALGGSILLFDALAELPLARLRMTGRPWRFAAVRLSGIAVNIGLNVLWLYVLPRWPGAPAWLATPFGGITYIFLATLASSVVAFAMLSPELRGIPWRVDRALLGRSLAFSLPLVAVGFSFIVNETFDRLIFPFAWPGGARESEALLGIYAGNYKLAMLLALFTQAFRYGAEPFFFREAGELGAQAKYARVAEYFLVAALLGALAVTLFLPVLGRQFLGRVSYREALDVVPVLLAANLCLGMYYNFAVWYKVTDATRFGTYISVGGAAATVVLNLLLIPRFGFYGCAWATLACYGGMMVATYVLGQRRYPVPYALGRMGAYALGAVALGFAGWFASPYVTGEDVVGLAVDGAPPAAWAASVGLGVALLAVFGGAAFVAERRRSAAADRG